MPELNTLLIFIRNPVKGKVKTRLAKTIGEDEAFRVYQELIDITRNMACSIPVDKFLYYSDEIEWENKWDRTVYMVQLQTTKDLGERMQAAFKDALQLYSKAVIIGSDCPELTPEIVNKAFEELETHDVVFGPSYDGGYYLLGMKRLQRELFQNIPWSTNTVLIDSIIALNKSKLSYSLLPALHDIDDEEDLIKWKKLN